MCLLFKCTVGLSVVAVTASHKFLYLNMKYGAAVCISVNLTVQKLIS